MKTSLTIVIGIFGVLLLSLLFDLRQHVVSIDNKLDSLSDSVTKLGKKADKSLMLKL